MFYLSLGAAGAHSAGKSKTQHTSGLPHQRGRSWGIYTPAPFGPFLRAAPEHGGGHFHPPWWHEKVSGKILQVLAVGNQTGKCVSVEQAQQCLAYNVTCEKTEVQICEDMTKRTQLNSRAGSSRPAVQPECFLWTTHTLLPLSQETDFPISPKLRCDTQAANSTLLYCPKSTPLGVPVVLRSDVKFKWTVFYFVTLREEDDLSRPQIPHL